MTNQVCGRCGQPIVMETTRKEFSYWVHPATGRQACLVVPYMASPDGPPPERPPFQDTRIAER